MTIVRYYYTLMYSNCHEDMIIQEVKEQFVAEERKKKSYKSCFRIIYVILQSFKKLLLMQASNKTGKGSVKTQGEKQV